MEPSIPVNEPPVAPVMDIVPPPASAEPSIEASANTTAAPTVAKSQPVATIKPIKKARPPAQSAILATVIIVLALAAMATFAYIKTN
jgi:hypothetical protein